MDRSVVIVAGGSGTRMKRPVPKQFLILEGKPILVYTIESFLAFDSGIHIILVLPEDHFDTWETLEKQFLPHVSIKKVKGGTSRFQSVKAGLKKVIDGYVAIHDAVRPFVPVEVIRSSFEAAVESGSGVAAIPLKDSIRQIQEGRNQAVPRIDYRAVQTPQTFEVSLIKKAFQQEEKEYFTDDATVLESAGYPVRLVMGDYQNIKITSEEDLLVAEVILKRKNSG